METNLQEPMKPSFSTLVLSIASSAAMAMGIAPNPQTQKTEVDKDMARFHVDLLILLRDKTRNNLEKEESDFIEAVISDLQMKFIQLK